MRTWPLLLSLAFAAVGTSQTTVPYGSATRVSLASGAIHTYQFQGVAGEKIVVMATADRSSSSNFDPCVEVRDPTGTSVGSRCARARVNRLELKLVATGAHQIVVRDHTTAVRAGTYTLALERVAPAASPNAVPMAFAQSRSASLSPEGELDVYTFLAGGGVPIRITTTRSSSSSTNFSACIKLYDPAGAVAGQACSTAATQVLSITTGLPGTYVAVIADEPSAVRDGSYTINLQCLAATCASTASYAPFGAGCAGTLGTPVLAAAAGSTPAPGARFTVELSGLPTAPFNVPVMFLGASNTTWSGAPLPVPLASIGMLGCDLLVSPDVVTTLVNAGGTAAWTILVPIDPGLIGGVFFNQGFVLDLGANATNVVASNGGRGIIG